MSEPLDEMRRWQEELAAMPEPVAYIVIDPNWSPSLPPVKGHDGDGKLYVLLSPAVMDEMEHRKYAGINIASSPIAPPDVFGIRLYKRADMPEGWPEVSRA